VAISTAAAFSVFALLSMSYKSVMERISDRFPASVPAPQQLFEQDHL
jgi:hypothetical protein